MVKDSNMHNRDELINAIQAYAQGIKDGTETILIHPAYSSLCKALDLYEMGFLDRIEDLNAEIGFLRGLISNLE
jgi:hypothetical protein